MFQPCLWVVLFWRSKPAFENWIQTEKLKEDESDLAFFALTQGCGTKDFSHLGGDDKIKLLPTNTSLVIYPKEAVMVLLVLDQLALKGGEEGREEQLDASNHLTHLDFKVVLRTF